MRVPIVLSFCLGVALASSPAAAQSDLPRHKPRLTDSVGPGDENASTQEAPGTTKRKHATPIGEGAPDSTDDDASAPMLAPRAPGDDAASRGNARTTSDDSHRAKKPRTQRDAKSPANLPDPARVKPVDGAEDTVDLSGRRSFMNAEDLKPPLPAEQDAPSTPTQSEPPPRPDAPSSDRDPSGTSRRPSAPAPQRPPSGVRATQTNATTTPVESLGSLASRDEPGLGISGEVALGLALLRNPNNDVTARFGLGGYLSFHLGRRLFAPETEILHNNLVVEVGYLHTSSTVGTPQVQVGARYHYLSAAVLFGYPLSSVLFYGKLGPSLAVLPVTYTVQSVVTDYSNVKVGFVYGVGARANLYIGDIAGIACRVEIVRFRRGYVEDLLLTTGIGAAF